MANLHMIIGLSVLASFVLLTIVNGLRFFRGASLEWARGLSFAAAGLLLIQYVLGFGLISGDYTIKPIHYILALAVIVPVGAEHMMAPQQLTPHGRARVSFFANLVAVIMIAVVYEIGQRNS